MKPGKLYRFKNIAEPIRFYDMKNQGGLYRDLFLLDVIMLLKIEKSYGCYDVQFLHKDKIGWILFPHKDVYRVENLLEEIEYGTDSRKTL